MSYVTESLAINERVVGEAHFHWWYRATAALALLILGVILIGIWIFFAMMIRLWTTEIAVTNQRFVYKRGLFRLDTEEIALPNIEGVKVHQSMWGRLLGYGRVRVEGTGVDAIQTPNIARPVQFRRAIENAKFAGHGPQPPAKAGAAR